MTDAATNTPAPGELPRILLLSDEGPHLSTAGAILLYRLLEDYPPEKLQVIERHADHGKPRLRCRYNSLRTPWRRFEQSRFHRWKRSMRALGMVPQVPSQKIEGLLNGYTPELVLCVMQHASYYDTAHAFARAHHLPLVVIVHDVNEQFEPVFPWALTAARRRDGAFYRYASRRLCVSPEMETLCAELYGVRGEVMYPNRGKELQPRAFEEARYLKNAGHLTVGFVGNLNYGYGGELLRLLPAFRNAGARIIAYSNPPGGKCKELLEAKDCFDFRGFAPAMEAWRAIQKECDAVILPYPHTPGHLERLYRYHFPSKLPEYLALGLPVIVTGPSYATGVKWGLLNLEATMTWIAAEPSAFAIELQRLRDDGVLRQTIAKNGYDVGVRAFDPLAIQTQFLEHLRGAVRGGA